MPRTVRDVVFVDGVRTPFGKAGGMYANTRADDLVIRCIRELLAPQPAAAAGARRRGRDRGHHPDRRPGPDHRPHRRAAGRPAEDRARLRHRPDVRRRDDRGDHRVVRDRHRRLRRRDRRRRRAHGPPPDGRGRRPQPADPRREAGRPVRAGHGLDRGEPARPAARASPRSASTRSGSPRRRRPRRRTPNGKLQPDLVPMAIRDAGGAAGAWPPSTRRRARRRLEKLATLKTPFRPHGKVTAGNSAGLNDGATACLLAAEDVARRARPAGRHAAGQLRLRRRRAGGHGLSARSRPPRRRCAWPA